MSAVLFLVANLVGLLSFVYPLLLPALFPAMQIRSDAPLLFFVLTGICLLVLTVDLAVRELDARTIALLGVLAALNALLRLSETAFLVMPGGFSPVFLMIILSGYAFGARFGFLFGAFSLLISALLTGGLGPWLPFQMTAAAWVGMGAGWLPRISSPQGLRYLLAAYGFVWGILFGFLMNLYYWPLIAGPTQLGESLSAMLLHYLSFYGLTSLVWDLARALGNVVLVMLFATPLLKVLSRFQRRTVVVYRDPRSLLMEV